MATMNPATQLDELQDGVETLLEQLGSFLGQLVVGDSGGGSSSELDSQLGHNFRQYSALRSRHRESSLSVAVLALTKSGKSTLLNSLIGEIILPSTNVPETARISTIQHAQLGPNEHPTLTYSLQDGSTHIVKSSSAIYDKLRWLNLEKRGRAHQLSDEKPLEIRTRIAALDTGGTVPKDISLKLLDTPGPNEAGEESLRYQVERLLETVDIVVYLLDWTKLKTQEEADLLKRLRDINPQLFARLSTRLFFCVNKADAIETSEGMDAEGTKEYVAELITRQLQHESFQLQPEQVILVSARDALLSRLVLGNKAQKTDLTRFRQLAFGRRATAKSDEQMRVKAEEMLQDSGVLELERRILSFLYGQSAPLKLLSCIDDCERLLHQVQNVALASHASLQADMDTLQATIARLQGELGSVLGEFSTLQDEAQQIEGVVVDEVQARMHDLKERLFSHVAAVLEATEDSPAAVRVRSGRWKSVWDKAIRFFKRDSVTHSDGEAADMHNADLQATLEELHSDIQEQISAEVAEFWHEVELALNVRQQSMFRAVNAHLERLSRAVEDVVGGLLSLRLEPVVVRMEAPSATEFHTSLQQLFAAGIGRQSSEVVRERTEDYVKWEKQHRGLCRHEYWVGVPSQRTVAEVYNETTFRLEPAKIKEHFMAQVEGRVAASTTYARAFVHQYVAVQISKARKNIESYAEQYSQTMREALNTHKEGEAARRASAARVEAHLTTMTRLLAQTEGLTVQVEGLLDTTATEPRDETTEFDLVHAPQISEDAAGSQRDAPQAVSAQGETASDSASAAEAAAAPATAGAVDSPAAAEPDDQAQAVPVPPQASPSWISALLFEHRAPTSPQAAPQQQLSTSQAPAESVTSADDSDCELPSLADDSEDDSDDELPALVDAFNSADDVPPLVDESAEATSPYADPDEIMAALTHLAAAAETAAVPVAESAEVMSESQSEAPKHLEDAPAPVADEQHSDQDDVSEHSAPAVLPAEFHSLDLGSPVNEPAHHSNESAKGSHQDGSSDTEDWLVVDSKAE